MAITICFIMLCACTDSQPSSDATTVNTQSENSSADADSPPDLPDSIVPDPEITFARIPEVFENAFEELNALRREDSESLSYKIGSFTATFGGIGSEFDVAPDGSMPGTAGGAVRNLFSKWETLDQAQKTAALRLMFPPGTILLDSLDDTNLPLDGELPIAQRLSGSDVVPLGSDIKAWLTSRFRFIFGDAVEDEDKLQIHILRTSNTAEFEGVPGESFDSTGTDAYATVVTPEIRTFMLAQGVMDSKINDCLVVIGPNWENETDLSAAYTLAHELVHCFQFELSNAGGKDHRIQPEWLIEGTATWVADQYMLERYQQTGGHGWWRSYFSEETYDLFTGAYDAVSFWQHVANKGTGATRGPYIVILNALQSSENSEDILSFLVDSLQDDFLRTWASSSFRETEYGPEWQMAMPQPLAQLKRVFNTSKPLDDLLLAGFGDSEAAELREIRIFATPTIYRVESGGLGYMHWEADDETTIALGEEQAWCTTDDCTCEDGSFPPGYEDLDEIPSTTLKVALTGTLQATSFFDGSFLNVRELCGDTEQDQNGQQGGFSFGDPHLLTFDGLYYSFQLAGEFVLAKSSQNGFEVQSRFAPWFGSPVVSMTTAIAMNIDGQAVQISGAEDFVTNQVQVDGQEVAIGSEALQLNSGGTIEHDTDSGRYVFQWNDGSIVEVRGVLGTLEVRIVPAEVHRGKMSGLFGNYDGEIEYDLALRSGEVVENSLDSVLINSIYADSWRLDMDESLFTYKNGNDTSTHTDLSFPAEFFKLSELLQLDAFQEAIEICKSNGITIRVMQLACAIDLFYTESNEFVQSAAYIENRLLEQQTIGVTAPESFGSVPDWYQCDSGGWAVQGLSPGEILRSIGSSIELPDEEISVSESEDTLFSTGQVYCSARDDGQFSSRRYSVRIEVHPTNNPVYQSFAAFGEPTLDFYVSQNVPDVSRSTIAGQDVAVSLQSSGLSPYGEVFVRLPGFDVYIQARVPESQRNSADLPQLATIAAEAVLSRIP